ncbi:MAG: hypothetical protein ACOC89_03520 [Candidatus Saliniplasma sp.]
MVESDIECILNDELGHVIPVVYRIQKDKMGFHGRHIPLDLEDQFVKGMMKLCRTEFEIDIDGPLYEQKLHAFVEKNMLVDSD